MRLPVAPYPFLRLALFFTSGIAAFIHFQLFIHCLEWIVVVLTTLFVTVYILLHNKKESLALGVSAYVLCFFFGAMVCKWDTEILNPTHFANIPQNHSAYIAIVDDEIIEKPNSFSTLLKVKYVLQEQKWVEAKGKVLAYFSPDIKDSKLKYGDWIVINGKPKITESPKNPGEFDYKRFLTFKNIYHQHFLKTTDWSRVKNEPPSRIWKLAFEARASMSNLMQSVMGKGQEFAVASMLVLGIRQTIDFDLFQAYSGAGAIHVLAVSGMHVGLVFALMQLLIGRLALNRYTSHVFYGLSLCAIWAFGLITAFSPSVLRAVVMFSVIILAKWTGRKGNLFNTLGFTAFVILLASPYTLMSVGFQMSFMAVVGIAFFQPRISTLWNPKNVLVKWVWEISCISISAQITTFPLALLYFKQFPTYFLLSNLWVIPASSLVLYVGILFFVGSFWVSLKIGLGSLLSILVAWLNKSMFLVLQLPRSVVKTASFANWEIMTLYLVILMLTLLFTMKDKRFLMAAILLSLTFSCARVLNTNRVHARNAIIVYSIRKTVCLAAIHGNTATVYADDDFLQNKSALEFHVKNPLAAEGVFDIRLQRIPQKDFLWVLGKSKIAVVRDNKRCSIPNTGVASTDYLFLSGRCTKMLNSIPNDDYKNVILQVDKDDKPLNTKLNVWNLQADGALELELSPDGKYYTRSTR